MMSGTTLNALGIVIGAMLGLMLARQFTESTQVAVRGLMGVVTVFIGLRITWSSLNGTLPQILKQVVVIILALALGRMIGQLLRIQKNLNRLGQFASQKFSGARSNDPDRLYHGFTVCTLLFCAGPIGPVGSVLAGLTDDWQPLAIKMVMDGLAAMGFACVFGWGVLLSALPVFVFQGAIALAAHRCQPFLLEHHLLDPTIAVAGMLVFCVSLVILGLKKIDLGDYLPSLIAAPFVAWLWP